MATVHWLPDECLCLIFDLLPVKDLVLLRLTCVRWQVLLELMCQAKHSLSVALVTSSDQNTWTNLDPLVLYLPKKNTLYDIFGHMFLSRLFPRVNFLRINLTRKSTEFAIMLISDWASQLNQLSLHIVDKLTPLIWFHLNRLPVLQVLQIRWCPPMNFIGTIPFESMTVMKQLHAFKLVGGANSLASIFNQLGPNIRSLNLSVNSCFDTIPRLVLAFGSEDLRNLSSLELNCKLNPSEQLQFLKVISSSFPHLESISLRTFSKIPIKELFDELLNFPRLEQVKEFNLNIVPNILQLPKLNSIILLELYPITVWKDTVSFLWHIPSLFPALKHIKIVFTKKPKDLIKLQNLINIHYFDRIIKQCKMDFDMLNFYIDL